MEGRFTPPVARRQGSIAWLLGVATTVVLFLLILSALSLGPHERKPVAIEVRPLASAPPAASPPPGDTLPSSAAPSLPAPRLEPAQAEAGAEPVPLASENVEVLQGLGSGGLAQRSTDFDPAGPPGAEGAEVLDRRPQMLDRSPLVLPAQILRSYQGTRGFLRVHLLLDEQGHVLEAWAEQSALPEPVQTAILAELRARRFTQPTRGGEPVRANVILPIPVSLK